MMNEIEDFLDEWYSSTPYITVHTSGSTGRPKELTVEKARMEASARMTCDFLRLNRHDKALLCMPVHYIAGKMMVVRSIVAGMELVCVKPAMQPLKYFCEEAADASCEVMNFPSPSVCRRTTCPAADVVPRFRFAAMTPSQVKATLESAEQTRLLRSISCIIIGGGHIDAKLEEVLRCIHGNEIWSTYGMTETLSHIAMRRVNGTEASCWYTPMAGVAVSLSADHTLTVNAPALCPKPLATNDIAEMNALGQFRILGRKDNVVNSGGVKIQIEDVEKALSDVLPDAVSAHFVITGCPDERFGEVVVMLTDVEGYIPALTEAMSALPPYWRPKRIQTVAALPQTRSGKPDRAAARQLAADKL